ncbi:MAG: hypothetical protein H6836_04145 [Planctomycetes bacterium]|nr:hypothetical protein [Planctomycetota bacterium]
MGIATLTRLSVYAFSLVPAVAQKPQDAAHKRKAQPPAALEDAALDKKLDAFREEIAKKMVSARVAAKGERRVQAWLKSFQVVQGKHYHVFTNGPKTTVKRFAQSLEQLYDFTKKLWPFEELSHHHRAYVFASAEEYYDFCTQVVGWSRVQAERSAGHATGAYYAAYYQSPKSETVMHEATHQIVHANLGISGVGSWFQEGMAEYAANTILGSKVSGGMRSDLRNGSYYPFAEFIAIPSLIADKHSSRNYTHAGCIIEFMMKTGEPRMAGKFHKLLAEAAQRRYAWSRGTEASRDLLKKVYGMTFEELEAAFLRFHRVKPKKRRPRPTPVR